MPSTDSHSSGEAKARRLSTWPAGVGWRVRVPLTLSLSLFSESVSREDYNQFITHVAIMILAPALFARSVDDPSLLFQPELSCQTVFYYGILNQHVCSVVQAAVASVNQRDFEKLVRNLAK